MRKLGRAGKTTGASKSNARRTSKIQTRTGFKWLSNWMAAQSRAARHRLSYLFKLLAVTVAGIAGVAIGVLTVFGQLDDVGDMAVANAQARLTQAGYTITWLDVSGSTRLSSDEIAHLIGIEPGMGLSELDLNSAKASLENQSWIESAELVRLWPDRLAIIVEERVPMALWQVNETHHVIDQTGHVIAAANPVEFAELPRIVGAGANEAAVSFLPMLDVYDRLKSKTTHILRIGERRWSLRLSSGTEILLPQSDVASALATLNALDEERGLLEYDAQLIDLRNPGELVMRPWPERAAQQAGRGA